MCPVERLGMPWVRYIISAWASALLVLTVMGNAKASARGTGDSTATHAFFVYAKTITLILIPCLGMLQVRFVKVKAVFSLWSQASRHAYPIMLILFILWMCLGIFPLICYETDSQEVILGCDIMYSKGWQLPPIYSYEYRMQPLTIIMIVALKYVFSFLTCEQIYCLVSAIFSIAFLVGCVEFAKYITRESRTIILFAAMLLPEMYAIAMYANSAIPAAACFIWAMNLFTRKKYWQAGTLLCIAPLVRVDVVIVYPAILPLFLFMGQSWKKSFLLSAVYALVVVVVSLALFKLCRADVLSTFGGYENWNQKIERSKHLMSIIGFYSVAYFILVPLGIIRQIRNRAWKELFLVLLPMILLHYTYRSMGCAAKHYLYIAPFVIIIGVRALTWIKSFSENRKVFKVCTVSAFILFMIVSVRITPASRPWFGSTTNYTTGVVCPIYRTEKVSVGIGAGQYVNTLDEQMLASGGLFYSWYIHSCKAYDLSTRRKSLEYLRGLPKAYIASMGWGAWAPISYMSLSDSYTLTFNKKKTAFTLRDEGHAFYVDRTELKKPDIEHGETVIQNFLNDKCKKLKRKELYVLINSPRNLYFFDQLTAHKKIDRITDALYLYKRLDQ